MKYLGLNLSEDVQDWYMEIHKTLAKLETAQKKEERYFDPG